MYLSPAQHVAVFNTEGVVKWAAENGNQIEPSANGAFAFLEEAYKLDPTLTLKKMYELHPHIQLLKEELGDEFPDKKKPVKIASIGKRKLYLNYTEDDSSEVTSQVVDILNEGMERGANLVRNNTTVKDHSKEILTYGAVLLAGIVIGKVILK